MNNHVEFIDPWDDDRVSLALCIEVLKYCMAFISTTYYTPLYFAVLPEYRNIKDVFISTEDIILLSISD